MISTAPEVDRLIDAGAPIVICVSGGKDSRLVATESVAHARGRGAKTRGTAGDESDFPCELFRVCVHVFCLVED